jgi:membrane associated rhomboid family serine protease
VVIPVHDVNPVRRTPWVTYGLIAANVGILLLTPVFAATGTSGDLADLCKQESFFQHFGAIPKELITNHQLAMVATGETGTGANGPGCVFGPPGYSKIPALSVLSSMFLHGGWLHLLGNMLFLWVFGNNIEDRFGRIRYLLLYFAAGFAAAYGYAYFNPNATDPLVGASGAISGVLGAYLVLYPMAKVWGLVPVLFFLPLKLPAWLVLGTWFVLQGLYASGLGVAEGSAVAYLAHIIGFVLGVLFALPFRRWRPPHLRYEQSSVMWRRHSRDGWR